MNKILYISLLSIMLFASCSSYNTALKSRDIEYRYEKAKAYYLEGKYAQAATLLESTVTLLKGSDKAEESLFLLGMCYYDSQDYPTAHQYFYTHYSNYPRGEYAELARYYACKSLYLDVPEPELDQTGTIKAIEEIQLFMEYFPNSLRKDEVQQMMFDMHDVLVEKEYLSAQLYYNLGSYMGNNYQACVITAQNALKDYPYTSLREDLSFLILKAKYQIAHLSIDAKKVDRYRELLDEYYAFKTEFPLSSNLKTADKFYNEALEFVNE